MKTVNIGGENLYIFWTTWRICMKFSGKMWLMIILKVTKDTSQSLLRDKIFTEKKTKFSLKYVGKDEGISLANATVLVNPSWHVLAESRQRYL